MSLYYCSLTEEVCEVPVVSKQTGHVYEKRIIEKYIDANGTCPSTGQSLTKEDLIEINGKEKLIILYPLFMYKFLSIRNEQ